MSLKVEASLCWDCKSLFSCPKKDNKLPRFAKYTSTPNIIHASTKFATLERVYECERYNKPISAADYADVVEPNIIKTVRKKAHKKKVAMIKDGEIVRIFESGAQAAAALGIQLNTLYGYICRHSQRAGCFFEYMEEQEVKSEA